MFSHSSLKKEFVAQIAEIMKALGYSKKFVNDDTGFYNVDESGHRCVLFHFADYNCLATSLDLGIQHHEVQLMKKPIHDIVIRRNLKSDIRNLKWQNTFAISWDHLVGQDKWSMHEARTPEEVALSVQLMTERVRNDSDKFFLNIPMLILLPTCSNGTILNSSCYFGKAFYRL